ncbi:hypothetical protein [Endozoicomonas sp.]|uniref:hypothetical protein n=1 Tax=Endozoicomonas sp. TaxID=1892382 RepID=UPI00383AC2E3
MALISQAQFSREQGFNKSYVHKLVKKGIIKLKDRKVDTRQALAAMEANADPVTLLRKENQLEVISPGSNPAGGAVDFVTARTMREAFKAKLAKLEYEEKSGQLTDASKVREDAFKAGRIIRDELLAIPDRLADVLAAEEDADAVRKIIFDELEQVLNNISK